MQIGRTDVQNSSFLLKVHVLYNTTFTSNFVQFPYFFAAVFVIQVAAICKREKNGSNLCQ
jgi:hypothetical protein